MILSNKVGLLSTVLLLLPAPKVEAHGYLISPRSRNYFAHTDGKWSGGTEDSPKPENCPHCLNIGGTEARCGLIEDRNYDIPMNSLGGIMPTVVQACYKPGAVIDLEVRLIIFKYNLNLTNLIDQIVHMLIDSFNSLSHGSLFVLRLSHFARRSSHSRLLRCQSIEIYI